MRQKGRETPIFPPKHVREHISNLPQNYSHTYSSSPRPHASFPDAKIKMKTELGDSSSGWMVQMLRSFIHMCKDLSSRASVGWSCVGVSLLLMS